MARPKVSPDVKPMDKQIEEAFWKLIVRKDMTGISVSEIIRKAHCNRSTFYYYYNDINDLAASVIKNTMPAHFPGMVFSYMSGDIDKLVLDEHDLRSIEKICILLNKSESSAFGRQLEDAVISLWIQEFGADRKAISYEIMCTMEFLAGGLLSVLSRNASPFDQEKLASCFRQINSVFSINAIKVIREGIRVI